MSSSKTLSTRHDIYNVIFDLICTYSFFNIQQNHMQGAKRREEFEPKARRRKDTVEKQKSQRLAKRFSKAIQKSKGIEK